MAQRRTEQRELRREIRNWLGSSTAPLPDLDRVLQAVASMNRLLQLVSGGTMYLEVKEKR
jgi:hypothetical protein